MRNSILAVGFLVLLLGLLTTASANTDNGITSLTYIIERQIDQADTHVQIKAKIQVDSTSLTYSIQTAADLITEVKRIVTEDCIQGSKKKSDAKKCQDLVEDSKFEVEPKYHQVRKIPTFTLFILSHELTIKVNNIKNLGKIIDQIVSAGGQLITIQELSWQTQDQVDPEVSTLKDGLAEGKELCDRMGKILVEVTSVEQLQEIEKDQGEEEDDGKDPDLTEAQVEMVIFKFKVVCANKPLKNDKAKETKKTTKQSKTAKAK